MTRKEQIEEAAQSEHIYEPKYGGKDHSGYDTMMKYEINYERSEAFENGAKWADANPDNEEVNETIQQFIDLDNLRHKTQRMLDVAENALMRALPVQEPEIALEVAKALSKIQKIRNAE